MSPQKPRKLGEPAPEPSRLPGHATDPGVTTPFALGGTAADKRVARLKDRFLFCWHHPKWVKWRRESDEDHKFHTGGPGQWDEAQRQKLIAKERAVLTINAIRPVIEILVGYERSARLEFRPTPVGQEDVESVAVFGRVIKKAAKNRQVDFIRSDGFKESATGGLAVWYVGVDYSHDLAHGEPYIVKCKRGEVVWDPSSQEYDRSDAQDMFWTKMVAVDVLKAQYGNKADEIDAAIGLLPPQDPGMSFTLPARDPHDAYKSGTFDAVALWDAKAQEIRVVEAWYRIWESVHLLVDFSRDVVEEIPPKMVLAARAVAAADPEQIKIIQRKRRAVEMSVFLPATGTELAHGNPFENDREHYPLVPLIAYEEGDEILGVVRNLKDPQRDANKRRSNLSDNAARHGSTRWFSTRDALENPEFLEGGDVELVGWLRNPNQRPIEVEPRPMPEWLWRLDEKAKQEIRDIALTPPATLGRSASGDSGIKLAQEIAQGQVGQGGLFDNYRRSSLLLMRRFAARCQQVYTSEMSIRLDTSAGESEWVTLNQRTVTPDGKVTVEREIPSLKWDAEIAESPSTPTARLAHAAMLGELLQRLPPEYTEALADVIAEFSELPNTPEIIQRIKMVQARKGILVEGNGGPPAAALAVPGGPSAGAPVLAAAGPSAPQMGVLEANLPPVGV